MKTRTLGSSNLKVSCLALGAMGYGDLHDRKGLVEVLRKALEHGVTLIDTAEIYGPWVNEILVGEAIQTCRDKMLIATKFGFDIDQNTGVHRGGVNSHPDQIRSSVEGSLRRLGVETIDLLYQHRVDPNVPMEDVAGTVSDLVVEGKVKYFGLSEAGPESIRRAHAEYPVTALQSEYSIWTRDLEKDIFSVLEELNIGLIPFSPLGKGFLTGKVDATTQFEKSDFRAQIPRFSRNARENNDVLIKGMSEIAVRVGCTIPQLALAWILAKKPWIVPLFGTRNLERLEENLEASNVILNDKEFDAVESLSDNFSVQGERYPSHILKLSNL